MTWTALVLAGRRGGAADRLAGATGVRHRALVPVCGVPMLLRVVRSLRASPSVGCLRVSLEDPEDLAAEPELARLHAQGALQGHRSSDSPSRSVLDVLERGEDPRLLVTTADHPLLEPRVVEHFLAAAEHSGADVCVGAVPGPVVRGHYPEARRTFLRARDGDWCGANLFALRAPAALGAARLWSELETQRKRPWRLVSRFGLGTLLRYALGRLDLETAFQRVSARSGARVRPVLLPFAEAALDVDEPADLELVSRILRSRSLPLEPPPSGAAGAC